MLRRLQLINDCINDAKTTRKTGVLWVHIKDKGNVIIITIISYIYMALLPKALYSEGGTSLTTKHDALVPNRTEEVNTPMYGQLQYLPSGSLEPKASVNVPFPRQTMLVS